MPARSLRRRRELFELLPNEFTGFYIEGGGEFAERRGVTIRDEFFLNRNGIRMVLYAGLIDAAHEQGIKSIDTDMIQIPDESNGHVAICKAVVEMESGARYSGIGDASPNNVSRNIVPHIIRQSETRAKARALRDVVNVGAVSLEEMGDEGSEQGAGQPTQNTSDKTEGGASRRSVMKLKNTVPEGALASLESKHGPVESWSQRGVSEVIKRFDKAEGKEGAS